MRYGQHRYLSISVFFFSMNSQSPKMRWCPRKDNQHQKQSMAMHLTGYSCPAQQRLRGARNTEAPLLNYLMAARASYALNEADKMREYLGAAEESESQAGIAVELTQAELKLDAGQYEQALATLVRARRNAGRHPQRYRKFQLFSPRDRVLLGRCIHLVQPIDRQRQ